MWIFNWSNLPDGGNTRSWVHPETVKRMGMSTGEPHDFTLRNCTNAMVYEGRLDYGISNPATFVWIGKAAKDLGGRLRTEWFFRVSELPEPSSGGYHEWWAQVRAVPQRKNRVAGSKLQSLVEDAMTRYKLSRRAAS